MTRLRGACSKLGHAMGWVRRKAPRLFSNAAMASCGWKVEPQPHSRLRTFQIDPKDLPIRPVAS
jgi:hypothetical protein